MDSPRSSLPDWWDRMIQALRNRRQYTWHVLTAHVEPAWDGTGTLTLTFPSWFAAVQWKARWCDDTLRAVLESGFPVRDVRLAWQTPAYAPTEWPGKRPTPASPLEALELDHIDACMAYGMDSPEAFVACEALIEATLQDRRERLRQQEAQAITGSPAKPGTKPGTGKPVTRPAGSPPAAPSKPRK